MEFQELIAQLKQDSNKYQFCEEGVDGINKSSSALQCCAFLRENIVYCFDSKYHDAIAENIEEWYKRWKKEFNQCGIWVNESPNDGKGIVVLAGQHFADKLSRDELRKRATVLTGKCRCYVFGKDEISIIALANSKVYSKNPCAYINFHNHSHGFVRSSWVSVSDSAICYAEDSRICLFGHALVHITKSCNYVLLSKVGPKIDFIKHLAFQ